MLVQFPPDHARRREALQDRLLPDWTADANCRSDQIGGMGPQTPGFAWAAAWGDDLAYEADPGDYVWPESVRSVLEACATCPVKLECLDAGFPEPLPLGMTTFYGRHSTECNRAAIRGDQTAKTCTGCLDAIWEQEFEIDPMPSGVFGGVPAPIREHYAEATCPDCEGRGDSLGFLLAGVDVAHVAMEFHPGRRGWPCERCGGTGRVANPDRVDACLEWAATGIDDIADTA